MTGERTNLSSAAIRTVAYFEAFKGAVVILAATGLLSMVHKDLHAFAARLIEHFHLNPASRYPRIFLDAATNLQDHRLTALAAGAAIYACARFVEAYGLYYERAWAEMFAAGSGAIYVPFEVANLVTNPNWHAALLLIINLAIVALMAGVLLRRRQRAAGSER